ncbi:hypothetical protein VPK24_17910 [Limnothrix redekei LRLZ20PSL1]|uniref:Uncharacterized protein n=1 Tax=Limnothrix redekei LRLZ20PSL1 TaxID=3112953 RepID=A0ABW7CEI2_9CYAN
MITVAEPFKRAAGAIFAKSVGLLQNQNIRQVQTLGFQPIKNSTAKGSEPGTFGQGFGNLSKVFGRSEITGTVWADFPELGTGRR